jgi:hypothetical protein
LNQGASLSHLSVFKFLLDIVDCEPTIPALERAKGQFGSHQARPRYRTRDGEQGADRIGPQLANTVDAWQAVERNSKIACDNTTALQERGRRV